MLKNENIIYEDHYIRSILDNKASAETIDVKKEVKEV